MLGSFFWVLIFLDSLDRSAAPLFWQLKSPKRPQYGSQNGAKMAQDVALLRPQITKRHLAVIAWCTHTESSESKRIRILTNRDLGICRRFLSPKSLCDALGLLKGQRFRQIQVLSNQGLPKDQNSFQCLNVLRLGLLKGQPLSRWNRISFAPIVVVQQGVRFCGMCGQ